jgi:hypothetical protein
MNFVSLHPLLLFALPSFILGPLLSLVLPAVVGALVTPVYAAVKRASTFVDNLPSQVHVMAVAVIAFVLPQLGTLIPGFTASTLAGVDSTSVQAILVFLASQVTHLLTAKPAPVVPTTPVAIPSASVKPSSGTKSAS